MPSVWDTALEWAEKNFESLEAREWTKSELQSECERLLEDFPGTRTKRWLFIYSPMSVSPFFEVSDEPVRMMMARSKMASVADGGGMLLGADFSEGWATPSCVGKFIPLAVCKPVHEAEATSND